MNMKIKTVRTYSDTAVVYHSIEPSRRPGRRQGGALGASHLPRTAVPDTAVSLSQPLSAATPRCHRPPCSLNAMSPRRERRGATFTLLV